MQLEISVRGADVNAKRLDDIGERGQKVRPVFDEIEGIFVENEQSIWRRNGGGGAKKWAPLSEDYAARKGNGDVLRRTGALEKSLTSKGAAGQVDKKTNESFTWGSSVFYGVFHSGNQRTESRGFPRRKILDLTPKSKKAIKEVIADYVGGDDVD